MPADLRVAVEARVPSPRRGSSVRPITVLHVVECWGGGVSTAVDSYVRATADCGHWLLTARRSGEDTGVDLLRRVEGWSLLPDGTLARVGAIARDYARIRPDVVHAHSSFAGLLVRSCPSVPRHRIVYSPHCFGFERTDLAPLTRAGIRMAETLMAYRTGTVAATSPHEARLARSLSDRTRVVHVPNAVSGFAPEAPERGRPAAERPLTVIAVGRVCRQKGPEFFARAAEGADGIGLRARWVWVGDGDARLRERLTSAGVHVTGWLSRRRVLELLGTAHVYAHTAEWESAPMALLEAAAAGLPIVARDIASMRELGIPHLVDTPSTLATTVLSLTDPRSRAAAAQAARTALSGHTLAEQADLLGRLYATVAGRPRAGATLAGAR